MIQKLFLFLLLFIGIQAQTNEINEYQTLVLNIAESSINKEHNTTLKVEAIYKDTTAEEVTDKVAWLITPSDAVKIEGHTLTALKDGNVTMQAKFEEILPNPVNINIYWEVDGHRLPPEPDPKINNATLLGVDVNHNGVRDDVERWIYRTYKEYIPCKEVPVEDRLPDGTLLEGSFIEVCEDHPVPYHPVVRAVAMQGARAAQIIIQNPEKAQETLPVWDAALDCDIDIALYLKNQLSEPIMRRLKDIQFNTVKRVRAYAQFNYYLGGGVYEDKPEEFYGCDENVQKYLKDLK
ncbi:hypothetical protein [Hydrogenimonas sp.]